jgi:hypothetical protein
MIFGQNALMEESIAKVLLGFFAIAALQLERFPITLVHIHKI